MSAIEIFEKHSEEYLKFEDVKTKISNRPDLHAFILLDRLFPSDRDIISASSHDTFFLGISDEDIETLNEETILDLVRCGVMFDDGLSMFA